MNRAVLVVIVYVSLALLLLVSVVLVDDVLHSVIQYSNYHSAGWVILKDFLSSAFFKITFSKKKLSEIQSDCQKTWI